VTEFNTRDMQMPNLIFARDIVPVTTIPPISREILEIRVADILKMQSEFFKSVQIRCPSVRRPIK